MNFFRGDIILPDLETPDTAVQNQGPIKTLSSNSNSLGAGRYKCVTYLVFSGLP